MAVAEKTVAVEVAPRNPRQLLMVRGVLGALYLLASFWLVFQGLPMLWRLVDMPHVFNVFLADALLFLATFPTVFALVLGGRILEGPNPPRGFRAAVFYLSFCTIVFGLLIMSSTPLWSVIGMTLLAGALVLYLQPRFLDGLVGWEQQGWFYAVGYKANQGKRVRWATVIGLMIVVIFGVWKLIRQETLKTGVWMVNGAPATDPWVVTMPFGTAKFVFLYYITLSLPPLLVIAAGWCTWRLVNWPIFADFLIATEAEMNKVSWASRRRLYQDTIVVLATVVLMTVFLFMLDVLWVKILTNPIIDVLKFDTGEAVRRKSEGANW